MNDAERPQDLDLSALRPAESEGLRSEKLCHALTRVPHAGRAYRARAEHAHNQESVEMLRFGETDRTGIAWRDTVWWLDASSPEEAVHRWMKGEGRLDG